MSILLVPGTATAAAKRDAKTLTTALAKSQSQITKIVVFTAATDPNKLLGRPGGYTSKTEWTDKRIEKAEGVDGGGTIEVYPNEKGAKQRIAYIQALMDEGVPFTTQYPFRQGPAVLRLSSALTPLA
jgi:hypothetical protein